MKEFFTKAIVLDKKDNGELDVKVTLYSPDQGKITAKVQSAKKITSKLNSHLEPFSIVEARIIDRGPQIVDALLIEKLPSSWELAHFLSFVREITLEGHADSHLWQIIRQSLVSRRFNYRRLLTALGFDPRYAVCQNCQRSHPSYFSPFLQHFFCRHCLGGKIQEGNHPWASGFFEVS